MSPFGKGSAFSCGCGKFRLIPETERPPEGGLVWRWYRTLQFGAGEEIRTLDPNLGKVMLYP